MAEGSWRQRNEASRVIEEVSRAKRKFPRENSRPSPRKQFDPKFDIYHNCPKPVIKDGISFRLDRIRSFPDLPSAMTFAEKERSKLEAFDTLYIYDVEQKMSVYYVTTEAISSIGENVPSSRLRR